MNKHSVHCVLQGFACCFGAGDITCGMHNNLLCFILLLSFLLKTGPDLASMGLANSMDDCSSIKPQSESVEDENGEIDLSGIDDDEIESYIMSEQEAEYKDSLWMKINAAFLKEQKGILLSGPLMTSLHYKLTKFEFYTSYWHFRST
jgi:hypothetical protein